MDLLAPQFSILLWTLAVMLVPATLIYCLYREQQAIAKIAWSIAIVCFPFLGGLIYWISVLVDKLLHPAKAG